MTWWEKGCIKKPICFSVIPIPIFTNDRKFWFYSFKICITTKTSQLLRLLINSNVGSTRRWVKIKNLVHPINLIITTTSLSREKLSTEYYHLQTTPPYEKGRKLYPLVPSNEWCLHLIDPNGGFYWVHINLQPFTVMISVCHTVW